jgi:hypothetical protein
MSQNRFTMRFPLPARQEVRVALEVYSRACGFFQAENSWCKGWFAEQADGGTCGPTNPRAVAFSLDGAVAKAMMQLKHEKVPPRLLDKGVSLVNWTLIEAIWRRGFLTPHIKGPIQEWNDTKAVDRNDVRLLLNDGEAILSRIETK